MPIVVDGTCEHFERSSGQRQTRKLDTLVERAFATVYSELFGVLLAQLRDRFGENAGTDSVPRIRRETRQNVLLFCRSGKLHGFAVASPGARERCDAREQTRHQ